MVTRRPGRARSTLVIAVSLLLSGCGTPVVTRAVSIPASTAPATLSASDPMPTGPPTDGPDQAGQPSTGPASVGPGSGARVSQASATGGPAPALPAFVATSAPITAADVPHSWRPGCPVGPDQLRLLRLSYWGFDQQPHLGTMIVNSTVAADVTSVFRTLYRERFPIRSMQPVDVYGGSDPASMAADNTSGFNCRYAVAPGKPQWSVHAYGRAVDVNAVENPYLEGGTIMPTAGADYVNRSVARPGMGVAGGVLVTAFAAVGWSWGGRWSSAPDYQHFSKDGG